MAKKRARVSRTRRDAAGEHALPSLSPVFGYIAVKELQRLEDRVEVLSRLGYGNLEIATIRKTTPQVVATLKARAKGRSRRR